MTRSILRPDRAAMLSLFWICTPCLAQVPACEPTGSAQQLATRASPYDSTAISVGNGTAKLCYSRPSARGRTIFGGLVPHDMLWRTGANAPTIIHLPGPVEIAGIPLMAGKYSVYTVPSSREWVLVINASTTQGGLTRDEGGFSNAYVEAVRAQEVGRALIRSERLDEYVEKMTFRSERAGADAAELILEWERTRVRIPIRARR